VDLGIGGLGNATEIGAGASAIVYRARQLDLDREVAVKVLSVTDEAFVRRFAREAKMLGKLSQNPGIVTVYDTGVTAAGQPYLILELCESSVHDHLQSADARFEPIEACRVGAQVADAVSDAHNNGVVHRDIKPGNILKSQTGRYMITDFGISTVTGATSGQTNSVGFTAGYVAPETLSGEVASTPADIYALGATMFHMMAGKPAFVDTDQHSNLLALAQRVINDPVPDLRPDGVPDEVCRIVEGAMAKRPQDRPTAAQLRDQLTAVVADLGPAAATASSIFGDPAQPVPTVGQAMAAASSLADSTVAAPTPPVDPGGPSGFDPGRYPAPDPDATAAMNTPGLAASAATDSTIANPAAPASPAAVPAPEPTGQQDAFQTEIHQPPAQPPAGQPPSAVPGGAGGILNDQTLTSGSGPVGPAGQPTGYQYEDDRRSLVPLFVVAFVGFLALLGAGAYLVSQAGDGSADDGNDVEAIDGTATSLDGSGNQSTGQDGGGGRGTLDPSSPTTDTTEQAPVDVQIPSVLGRDEADARATLEALGFTVNPVDRESPLAPGTVLEQSPNANQSVPEGSTISIFIATPAEVEQVAVPVLINKSLAAAEAALVEAGLTLSTPITREFHPTIPLGQVISSSPTSGITVNVDTAVSLVISDGPKPPACENIAGLAQAEAVSQLQAADYTVTTSPGASTTVDEGLVISCTANEDATTVALVISAGDVCGGAIGSQIEAATTTLEAKGFTVTAVGQPDNSNPAGEVTACTTNGEAATLTHAVAIVPPTDCSNVVGEEVSQALADLTEAGFTTIEETTEPSDTVPAGSVISCTANGTTASLVESSGPSTDVTVPDVVGRRRNAGLVLLRAAGFDVEVETVDSGEPSGEIVATRPGPGAAVAPGTTITVEVSNGNPPTVEIPDVIGDTQAAATAALTQAGLVADPVTRTLAADDPRIGQVINTSPGVGADVEVGTTVRIVVGTAPDDDEDG
jgi:beta-lactam-binding protein with PASTA domain/serine/threonine protein kinase